MRHRYKFLFFFIIIYLLCGASFADSEVKEIKLPDEININGGLWAVKSTNVTKLNDFGYWTNKIYENKSSAGTLEANLIIGGGELHVDLNKLNSNKNFKNLKKAYDVDPKWEYMIFKIKINENENNVNEYDAVFESRDFLPDSLSVNLDKNSVLTLESRSLKLKKDELIEAAAFIIKFIKK